MKHTRKYLMENLGYDAQTGIFRWMLPRPKIKVGQVAGSKTVHGDVHIEIDGKNYKAHRLRWPKGLIDHKNRIRSDNRINNLRRATRSQNTMNSKIRSSSISGIRGVWWANRQNKWKAGLHKDGSYYHLGYFENKEAAIAARNSAELLHFGEFRLGA